MRVLLSPRAAGIPTARAAAERLAGAGAVVALPERGVTNLERRLTPAEVDLIRRALTSAAPADPPARPAPGAVVGYVCSGGSVADKGSATSSAGRSGEVMALRLVAVGDHANLTWRSPLWGPDDETLGERFPVTAGIYRPDVALAALDRGWAGRGGGEATVAEGEDTRPCAEREAAGEVVVGVGAHGGTADFVRSVMATRGWTLWSAELVPVALVAAHLGLGMAAVVAVVGTTAFLNDAAEGEEGS